MTGKELKEFVQHIPDDAIVTDEFGDEVIRLNMETVEDGIQVWFET